MTPTTRLATCCRLLVSMILLTGFSAAQSRNQTDERVAADSSRLPELIPREREIEMALSAAPEHLRKDATVYVLQRGGFVKAREGTNGFSCLVEREGVTGTAPVCFDREGSETTLLMVFRKATLIEQGKSDEEAERVIDEEYSAGKLLAPRKPGLAYMLSTEFKTRDQKSGRMVTVFAPHLMFYAPYMKNSDIGATQQQRGSQSQPWVLNEGKPYAYIIVVPKSGDH